MTSRCDRGSSEKFPWTGCSFACADAGLKACSYVLTGRPEGPQLRPPGGLKTARYVASTHGARCAEEFVGGAEYGPAQTQRIVLPPREERADGRGDLGRAVAPQGALHPARGEEDVAGPLDLAQHVERRPHEPLPVLRAQRVIQILQAV